MGITSDPDADYDLTYAYDTVGRLEKITGNGLMAGGVVYERVKNGGGAVVSERIGKLSHKDGSGATVVSARWTYEANRDLITSLENHIDSVPVMLSSVEHEYDDLGRREYAYRPGHWWHDLDLYDYNDRSELIDSQFYWGSTDPQTPGTPMHGESFTYDPIGNRLTSQVAGASVRDYTTNAVNQYTAIDDPAESFTYDEDGNMTSDGTWTLVWDATQELMVSNSIQFAPGTRPQ